MNMQRIIQHIGRGVCYAIAMVGLASCIADDLIEQPGTDKPLETGLYLAVQADGDMQTVVTRSPGVDALNENLIQTVDIFVFKEDGTLNTGGYVHADATANDYVAVYTGAGWKDNFEDGETYTLYALANYKGTDNLSEVANLDDLKEMRMTDADIVYWQGMPGYTGDKTFLMDGSATFDTSNFPTGNQPYELEVPVRRAAVKVEVTLNFSEEWAAKFTANDLKAQATNYASVTTAIADGYALTDDQRGYVTMPNGGAAVENFTDDFVVRASGGGISGSTIRFYSYVNRWDDLVTNETMMLIDLPGTLTEGEEAQTFLHNFYKIPLISNTAEPVMQRNTFYQVTATVDMLGTEEIDEPVTLQNVHFKTAEWVSSTIPVGEGDSPQYLILSEYHKDIRNADGFNEGDGLEFYSSSVLSEVRVATSQEIASAIASGDITFNYPGEGNSIPGIFFVNKDNQRVSVDADDPNDDDSRWDQSSYNDKVEVSFDNGVVEGKIHLTSTNPENVTKRYITLKVMNEDGLSKYVVIEQYPLEYIQPIQGYYSYRDDFLTPAGVTPQGAVHWGQTYQFGPVDLVATETQSRQWGGWGNSTYELNSPGGIGNLDFTVSNGYFTSKVYYNKSCYYYTFDGANVNYNDPGWTWGEWEEHSSWVGTYRTRTGTYNDYLVSSVASPDDDSGNDNPMMYFVTISQTNTEYKIAHPVTENVEEWGNQVAVVNSSENDKLVSPTFMLASQLGAVYSSGIGSWSEARKHCAYYVETYQKENGEVVHLDDWRLPTSAEIQVIIKYQNDPNTQQVMEEVLGGRYYYVSWSGANNGSGNALVDEDNDSGTFIRCIRDVKPDDAFLQNTNQ